MKTYSLKTIGYGLICLFGLIGIRHAEASLAQVVRAKALSQKPLHQELISGACLVSTHSRCFEIEQGAKEKEITLRQYLHGAMVSNKTISAETAARLRIAIGEYREWTLNQEQQIAHQGIKKSFSRPGCFNQLLIEFKSDPAAKQKICRDLLPQADEQNRMRELIKLLASTAEGKLN